MKNCSICPAGITTISIRTVPNEDVDEGAGTGGDDLVSGDELALPPGDVEPFVLRAIGVRERVPWDVMKVAGTPIPSSARR